MKASPAILIERVSNGWIVRPFSACHDWATMDTPYVAVFKTVEELQSALPSLLALSEPLPEEDAK